jgi:hypothetical protein
VFFFLPDYHVLHLTVWRHLDGTACGFGGGGGGGVATATATVAAIPAEVGNDVVVPLVDGVVGIICNGTDGTWTGMIAPGGILAGTWTYTGKPAGDWTTICRLGPSGWYGTCTCIIT